jgi:hypothetical protein
VGYPRRTVTDCPSADFSSSAISMPSRLGGPRHVPAIFRRIFWDGQNILRSTSRYASYMSQLRRLLPHVFNLAIFIVCIFQTLASSASPIDPLPTTELVLQEGSRLEVASSKGNIAIVAGKGLARQYQWDGCALDSQMHARTHRWFGSLGAYDPASRMGKADFLKHPSCKGVSRTVVEEGQIHFSDLESAEEWIRRRSKSWTTVWTNDGLVVSWIVSPAQSEGVAIGGFSLDLKLMCINGQRPSILAGSSDQAVKLVQSSGHNQAVHKCATVGSDVIAETRRVLIENWKKYGGYVERKK